MDAGVSQCREEKTEKTVVAFVSSVLPWEVGTIGRFRGQADGETKVGSITACLRTWVWKAERPDTMHQLLPPPLHRHHLQN